MHGTEELAYLASGFLLFQLVFGRRPGPWQLSGGGRMALLALVTPVDTVVGVVRTAWVSPAGASCGVVRSGCSLMTTPR